MEEGGGKGEERKRGGREGKGKEMNRKVKR